ncbi:MAG: DUF3616 domain-containing protein, partial [Planctomycetes bacterium]|nr:DUF3616 domain-containing protein [Planctomycetota bacterium]
MRLRSAFKAIAASFAMLALADISAAGAFTPGNLVVVRVGDGSAALTSAATVVFLDEYTPSGTLVQTLALPTTTSGAQLRFTNNGTATSEGFITLSSDGLYLVHGGYDAAPGTAAVSGTTSAANPRVVARWDLAGNLDTSTGLTDAHSAGNIRSVASDGTSFWTAGSNASVRYAAALGATTTTQLATTPTNCRVVGIEGGQLYVSNASGAFQGVSTVGTGLPTTSGQTITLLPGFPTTSGPSSYDYFFADASTLYVADDRTSTSGGIQKWTLSAGTWTLQYTLNPVGAGCRGITGVVNAGVATLFATTTASNANTLVTVTDTGAGSTFTTIAATGTNTALRGVRFIPGGCTVDSDGDLTPDCTDGCPNDANKIAPGICGCGVSDADTDGDGTADCIDGCPADAYKIAPGQCGCGVADTDSDGDGTADCNDGCP